MKYLAFLILLIVLVRIDFFLGLFDKALERFESRPPQPVSSVSPAEIIPFKDDRSFQQTPRTVLLSLLQNFRMSPTQDMRERILKIMKDDPSVIQKGTDKEFEEIIFSWRDLLIQNNQELLQLLLDLLKITKDENRSGVKKFLSLQMDMNMDSFIKAYSKAEEPECSIASWFGDVVIEDEKLNLYYDRVSALNKTLSNDKLSSVEKNLALACLKNLNQKISEIAPLTPTSEVIEPEMIEPELVPMEEGQ